jgi:hypothetical protein
MKNMEQSDVWDFGVVAYIVWQTRNDKALTKDRTYRVNFRLPKVPFQEKRKSRLMIEY